MSKYNKRLRIRPVKNSLVAEPRYYFECKDWYGGVGTGLTIRQAYTDYLKETKPQIKEPVPPAKSEYDEFYKQTFRQWIKESAPKVTPVVNQHKHNYIDTDGNVMVGKLLDAIFQLQINHETSFGTKPEKLYLDPELLLKLKRSLPKQGTTLEGICGIKVITMTMDMIVKKYLAFWLE